MIKKIIILVCLLLLSNFVHAENYDVSINLIVTSTRPYEVGDIFEYDVTVFNNGKTNSEYSIEYIIEDPLETNKKTLCCQTLKESSSKVHKDSFVINKEGSYLVKIKVLADQDENNGNNQANIAFNSLKAEKTFVLRSSKRQLIMAVSIILIAILFLITFYKRIFARKTSKVKRKKSKG